MATKRNLKEDTGMSTFKLIKAAKDQDQAIQTQNNAILAHLTEIAAIKDTSVVQLSESVTHLLANLAMKAQAGEPFDIMKFDSITAFLAGVDAIAQALPSAEDMNKKSNTLRVLATAGLGSDGQANDATMPIINLGARKSSLRVKYVQMLHDYIKSLTTGSPQGETLARTIRQLQMSVDRAMRSASQPRSIAAAGPSRPGSAPASI